MSLLNSISSFFDDLTTSRRHAPPKRPVRSTSPSQLPFYTNGHPQSSSTNTLPLSRTGISPVSAGGRQASWEAPTPSLRSTSTTQLRIPSSPFIPPDHRKPASGIQLQELSPNGIQPPPPVADSWARIDAWAESHYPELYDQLSYPATSQDVDDLEAELDVALPMDVRQSLCVHDGQDRGGKPTGILFGVTLLDCEEIVEEWQLWKTVAQAYQQETASSLIDPIKIPRLISPTTPQSTVSEPATSSPSATNPRAAHHRQSRLFGQTARFASCRPPDTIQKVYAHPQWIPLAKDFSGNNIAVDLCPGPRGTWGQVILFGRDCDTKYVVARSWASFLAAVADDFESGEARFEVDEDAQFRETFREIGCAELRIRPCQGARDNTFLEVLKGRVRLREREVRRRREIAAQKQQQQQQNGVNGVGGGKVKSPTVDLMVNSPILNGDGIPSPNLPRSSDSIAGSPAIGTPIVSSPLIHQRQSSVTISGPELLAKELEEKKAQGNKIVSGGIVVDSLASPILVKKSAGSSNREERGTASTGLGIENGGVGDGEVS